MPTRWRCRHCGGRLQLQVAPSNTLNISASPRQKGNQLGWRNPCRTTRSLACARRLTALLCSFCAQSMASWSVGAVEPAVSSPLPSHSTSKLAAEISTSVVCSPAGRSFGELRCLQPAAVAGAVATGEAAAAAAAAGSAREDDGARGAAPEGEDDLAVVAHATLERLAADVLGQASRSSLMWGSQWPPLVHCAHNISLY
jgi:hypothetical protein